MRNVMGMACLAGLIGLAALAGPAWAEDQGPGPHSPQGHPEAHPAGRPDHGHAEQGHPDHGRPEQGGPEQGHPQHGWGAPGRPSAAPAPVQAAPQPSHPAPQAQQHDQPRPHAQPPHAEPQHARPGGPDWQGHHHFAGREVRRFGDRDLDLWRGGGWHQGWHGGRFGWWWAVDGVWYFYDRPVYPFPTVVSETYYIDGPPPPVVAEVVPPAPVAVAPPTGQPSLFWLYCDDPAGYYPFVTACNGMFRPVPVPNQ